MRTRTLILAAPPHPFKGAWVELGDGEWHCRVICEPDELPTGAICLNVIDDAGPYTLTVGRKTIVAGHTRVQAQILKTFAEHGHVTILMEARNGLHDGHRTGD